MGYRIGFHARSIEELSRVCSIDSADLVEIKPDKLKKNSGFELYRFEQGSFTINDDAARRIKKIAKDRTVQLHVPYERKKDSSDELGLCQAVREHHQLLLDRFHMYACLQYSYGIGGVLTVHPPIYGVEESCFCTEEQALKTGREFYEKLDDDIKQRGYGFKIGIENMVKPKKVGTIKVGYRPEHLDFLIGETSEIGVTIDSGHKMLNDKMPVESLLSHASIVNAHFHSNSGDRSDDDYDDDEHMFATEWNFSDYHRYLKVFRRRKMPIVLEIDDLEAFTDEEISGYVIDLRKRLEN